MPTTFNIKRGAVCAGGGHHHIQVTQGTKVREFTLDTDFIRSPVTEDEIKAMLKVLTRAGLAQLTPAQAVAKIVAGFNVVID